MFKKLVIYGVLSLPLLASAIDFSGMTPEEKGLAIAKEADSRDKGFGDHEANMLMVLKNEAGDESTREVRVRTMEVEGDGDKSLTIFDKPADLKGTAMLTHSHGVEPDDQWLYLPSFARVKRINSSNKSGPFMGSEFAFEDLSSQELEKYTYRYLQDGEVNGVPVFEVEQIPAYKYSGYARQVISIDKERFIPLKVVFYDRKDALYKTLVFEEYKQYLDKYWRAQRMIMTNHQTKKSTLLTWSDYQFNNGFTDSDFTKNTLKRIR